MVFLKERLAFHQKVTKFLEKIGLKKSNKIAPAPTKQSSRPPPNTEKKKVSTFSPVKNKIKNHKEVLKRKRRIRNIIKKSSSSRTNKKTIKKLKEKSRTDK